MRRTALAVVFVAALLSAAVVHAEHTRFWEQSSYADFDKGTHQGVALRSDGTLVPAPEFKSFADPNLAYAWALAVDSKGRIYVAGGSDAKVLRLDTAGKATQIFHSAELETQALAIDRHDNIYAATAPDGKVYKITPEGQQSVFFDPKTKYIWALAFDSKGTLFVATGDKGEIFAVAPDGQGRLFYKSEESHARALAFDSQGDLLVGTDPSGLVLRIPIEAGKDSSLPQAGKAFVIYETDKKEVTSLLSGPNGMTYVAAVGNKARVVRPVVFNPAAQLNEERLAADLEAQRAQMNQNTQAPIAPAQTGVPLIFPPFPSASGGSAVYQIAPDGSPKTLWTSAQDVVYSLAFSNDGHLLAGTGNHGEVIELDGGGVFFSLASADASQVTALAAGPGHAIYVATANPGKVFTLGPGYAAQGTFQSDAFDAKIFSHWGRLSWSSMPGESKTAVEFYVRSGNTSDPDNYWSPWEGPYTDSSGVAVQCPPARYVQWKAVFHAPAEPSQPSIAWVKLAYLPKNVAPVIEGIVVEKPGIRAQGFLNPQTEQQQRPSTVPLRLPEDPANPRAGVTNFSEFQRRTEEFAFPTQGIEVRGYETVIWRAHDDNDDKLVFALYYRGQGEKDWRLLKDKIDEDFYSWDTDSMPDGIYYLKLVASDSPSNPPSLAKTADRVTDSFQVDNTPPTIENLHAVAAGEEWHIRFTAHDSATTIARASYSLDSGDWEMVFPIGQLSDAPSEEYDLALSKLAPGEHTVAVRIFDQYENSIAAKVTFTVPAASR